MATFENWLLNRTDFAVRPIANLDRNSDHGDRGGKGASGLLFRGLKKTSAEAHRTEFPWQNDYFKTSRRSTNYSICQR
jgi:hypothetical protein